MVIKKIKVQQLKRVIRFTKYKTYITEYNLDYSKKYTKKKRIVGTVNTFGISNSENITKYKDYDNLDNINGWPTSIRYRDTYITFIWHKNGKLHRDNGPAVMNIDQYRRQAFSKYYYINGKKIDDELQILIIEDGY